MPKVHTEESFKKWRESYYVQDSDVFKAQQILFDIRRHKVELPRDFVDMVRRVKDRNITHGQFKPAQFLRAVERQIKTHIGAKNASNS